MKGGTIIPSIGSATIYDTFDLTLTVNSGYEFNGLYLDNEKANLTPTITSNSDGSYQYLFSDIDMKENGYVIRADLKKLSSEEIEKPNEDFYLSGGFIFTGENIDGDGNIINEGTKGDQLFEDGSGSKEVPLIIKSDEQFKNINNDNVKKIASKITFELSSDITTTETIDFTIAREVTLNLNGKNLSINNGTNTLVTKDRKLVIDGGKDLNNKGKLNIPQIKNSTASAITIDEDDIKEALNKELGIVSSASILADEETTTTTEGEKCEPWNIYAYLGENLTCKATLNIDEATLSKIPESRKFISDNITVNNI